MRSSRPPFPQPAPVRVCAAVFAVGRRVYVACPDAGRVPVPLMGLAAARMRWYPLPRSGDARRPRRVARRRQPPEHPDCHLSPRCASSGSAGAAPMRATASRNSGVGSASAWADEGRRWNGGTWDEGGAGT
jgi:hypothetical protein